MYHNPKMPCKSVCTGGKTSPNLSMAHPRLHQWLHADCCDDCFALTDACIDTAYEIKMNALIHFLNYTTNLSMTGKSVCTGEEKKNIYNSIIVNTLTAMVDSH